jgi:hypothetical protein
MLNGILKIYKPMKIIAEWVDFRSREVSEAYG